MLNRLISYAVAAALAVSAGYASQSNTNVTIPVKKTAATSGEQMYTNYCAPCHGVDGRGSGPVSSSLKAAPIDLTLLSKNNGGKFPTEHIVSVLESGSTIPSHGSSQMPVWGPVFGKMGMQNTQERSLRIKNLRLYLESIQVK